MATKKDKDEEIPEVENRRVNVAETISDPERSGTTMATSTGRRPRVSGRMAKPVYLIHHGKFEVTIPAETREVVMNDPEDEDYGKVVYEEIVPEYTAKGDLPKGSRFGSRKIGVAHEVWDAHEAKRLKERGFVEATEAEVKKASSAKGSVNTDAMAEQERQRALKKFRTGGGAMRASDVTRDEE